MNIYSITCVYYIIFVWFTNPTDALDCYHCTGIDSPSKCHTLIVCPKDYQCYIVEEPSTNGTTFTLGCIPTSTCLRAAVNIIVIGRRFSRSLSHDGDMMSSRTSRDAGCSMCCDRDACNKHACDDLLAPTTVRTPSPPPTPTPFEFHTAAPGECRDDIAWCRTIVNVCLYSTRHECRKFCNLCSSTDGSISSATTIAPTQNPNIRQCSAWGNWTCAHLSWIYFMALLFFIESDHRCYGKRPDT